MHTVWDDPKLRPQLAADDEPIADKFTQLHDWIFDARQLNLNVAKQQGSCVGCHGFYANLSTAP